MGQPQGLSVPHKTQRINAFRLYTLNELILTVTLNKSAYPVLDTEQLGYVLVEARPTIPAGQEQSRPPLNLALVLDRSGSMAGEKLDNLKRAARLVVQRLSPQDMLTIILFDDRADIWVPCQFVRDPQMFLARIEAIQERGGTHLSTGLAAGLQQLQTVAGAGRVNRLILLTDGETWEDADKCRELARQAGQSGVVITALGLGEEWNQQLLTDIAVFSGGNWHYIDDPAQLVAAFQNVVSTMQATTITNVNLILRLLEGVRPRTVWRVTPLIDRLSHQALSARDVQVYLGDLQIGGQSALVELTWPPRQTGHYRLAQAELRYDQPLERLMGQKVQQNILVSFAQTGDTPPDGRVMNVVEKVTAFKLQTQALADVSLGHMAQATQKLRAAATRLLSLGEEEKAQEALNLAEQLNAGQALSARQTKRFYSATRKLDTGELLPGT